MEYIRQIQFALLLKASDEMIPYKFLMCLFHFFGVGDKSVSVKKLYRKVQFKFISFSLSFDKLMILLFTVEYSKYQGSIVWVNILSLFTICFLCEVDITILSAFILLLASCACPNNIEVIAAVGKLSKRVYWKEPKEYCLRYMVNVRIFKSLITCFIKAFT